MLQTRKKYSPAQEKRVLADCERYRQLALDKGADFAKVLPISDIVQSIRARMVDAFPRAASEGLTYFGWPMFPTPWKEAKAIVNSYHYAILARIPYTMENWDDFTGPTAVGALGDYWLYKYKKYWPDEDHKYWDEVQKRRHGQHSAGLQPAISKGIEDTARKDGYQYALSGFSGSCSRLCCKNYGPVCVALTTGICRQPGKTRPQGTAATLGLDHPAIYQKLGIRNWVQGWSVFPEDYPKDKVEPPPARTSIVFID